MHCVFQVVKLKDEYISNLESSTSIDESEERPHMNPSLKAALWCATASCASARPQTKNLSVLIISAFTAFSTLMLSPPSYSRLLQSKDSKRLSHSQSLHGRLQDSPSSSAANSMP